MRLKEILATMKLPEPPIMPFRVARPFAIGNKWFPVGKELNLGDVYPYGEQLIRSNCLVPNVEKPDLN